MEKIVHEFSIRCKGSTISLKASFEITKTRNGGHAVLDGEIFLAEDDIPWDGKLTSREKDKIEREAWAEVADEPYGQHQASSDMFIVDEAFDDGFDVNMAIKVAGQGSVTW